MEQLQKSYNGLLAGVREIGQNLAMNLKSYRGQLDSVWRLLSMRAKLTIIFGGMIVTMTLFFYVFAVYQTTREIKLSAVNKGQAIAEALKGEVSYGLLSGSYPNLDLTFRRLASSRSDIAYMYLLGPSGEVLAHSETDQVGRKYLDPISRRSLTSTTPRVQFHSRDLEGRGEYSDLCDLSVPILLRGKRTATLRIGVSLTQSLLANGPRIRARMALFALPFACLAILIAMKLADSFTRPLRRLAQATSEVSRGNYDIQLPLNRQDELGDVAQAFNTMAQHLKENFAKVSDMANRDGLTGLYNARFFHEALAQELERTKRSGRPLSLLIFDADYFKRINDKYGHPMGDQILQHISRVAHSVLRGYDVLARYGGEEFIAMLTDTTGAQALLLGERLRKVMEQRPFIMEEGDVIKVTISVGVADAHVPYERQELISHADQALYQAKESGRNKVAIFKHQPADTSSLKIAKTA